MVGAKWLGDCTLTLVKVVIFLTTTAYTVSSHGSRALSINFTATNHSERTKGTVENLERGWKLNKKLS